MKAKRLLCFALCLVMLVAVFAGCNTADSGNEVEETTKKTPTVTKPVTTTEETEAITEGNGAGEDNTDASSGEANTDEVVTDDTTDDPTQGSSQTEIDNALAKIESYGVDFSGETFNILCREGIEKSFDVQGTTGEPLEDAVFTRNSVFFETYGVQIVTTKMSTAGILDHFKADVKSSYNYDYFFAHTNWNIDLASQGYLYNFIDLEPYIDLSKSWWDEGTKSFNIADSIWFMNGSFNYDDDATTYCLMFNKEIAENYFQTNDVFYSLVNAGNWTLDEFYSYAQKASKNIGDQQWDEKDQYGFVTTWEYGTTFFYGSGLNYVKCEKGQNPVITLDATSIKKATSLLEKLNSIYATEVTYWPEGGMEQVGKEIFWGGRCLFFGEIVENVVESNKKMEADFGVLPIPKYDANQKNHISWTHGISSSMTIANHVENVEKFGLLLEAFNVLSEQYVRPAYYDVVLTRKSVQDADSKPMLDIIFKGRTYDLAMYYDALGLVNAFKKCVNEGKTGFAQEYASVKKAATTKINSLVRSFEKLKK